MKEETEPELFRSSVNWGVIRQQNRKQGGWTWRRPGETQVGLGQKAGALTRATRLVCWLNTGRAGGLQNNPDRGWNRCRKCSGIGQQRWAGLRKKECETGVRGKVPGTKWTPFCPIWQHGGGGVYDFTQGALTSAIITSVMFGVMLLATVSNKGWKAAAMFVVSECRSLAWQYILALYYYIWLNEFN